MFISGLNFRTELASALRYLPRRQNSRDFTERWPLLCTVQGGQGSRDFLETVLSCHGGAASGTAVGVLTTRRIATMGDQWLLNDEKLLLNFH